MPSRRAVVLTLLLALAHAAAFARYQSRDWTTQWSDQEGYRRLGDALARTGRFTRYPDVRPTVPEVLHTPGYPAFLAVVYRVAGEGHVQVAVAQAALFAILCLVAMLLTREVAGTGSTLVAGLLTAAYAPLPYFGALMLTEFWTAFLLTIACWRTLVALRTGRVGEYAVAGVVYGAVALTRPAFVLLPFFLAAVVVVVRATRRDGAPLRWAALLLAFGATLVPWLGYNYVYFHRITMSPAGGIGRSMWEGTWQGVWDGRTEAELTGLAASQTPDIDRHVGEIAVAAHRDPQPMIEYVRQWRYVRAIWDTPTAPAERAAARIEADREYLRLALENERRDPIGYAWRRLTRGTILLWAGDIPIRYSDINRTPPLIIHALWFAQGVLVVLALNGLRRVWRSGQERHAAILAAPLLYVTLVHLPLTTEARLALPAKPIVLALAAVGVAARPRASHAAVTSPRISAA